jgi:hypothetical protein
MTSLGPSTIAGKDDNEYAPLMANVGICISSIVTRPINVLEPIWFKSEYYQLIGVSQLKGNKNNS